MRPCRPIWPTDIGERLRQRMAAVLMDLHHDAVAAVGEAFGIPEDRRRPRRFGRGRCHRAGRMFGGKRPPGSSIHTQAIPAFSA